MLKKITAAFLLVGTILTAPAFAYAAVTPSPAMPDIIREPAVSGDSEELTKAILKAKTIIGDTDKYSVFNHEIYSNNGVTLYELYWSGHADKEPDINMTVGSDGSIYRYSKYYDYYRNSFVVPDITKEKAVDLAYDFAVKLNPEYASSINKNYATAEYNRYGLFNIYFIRTENGVIIEDNNIMVSLTGKGEVYSYSSENMAKNVVPPAESQRATRSAILSSFKKNLPFEAVYRPYYPENSEKAKIQLVYRLNSDYRNTAVDALSGNIYKLVYEDFNGGYMRGGVSMDQVAAPEKAKAASGLSEAETAAAELQESFIKAEKITEKIKSMSELGQYDLVMTSSSLYKNESQYSEAVKYVWHINYKFTVTEDQTGNAYVSADAETGIITNFYCSGNVDYKKASEYKYTDDDCRAAAEAFLLKYYGDFMPDFKPVKNDTVIPYDNYISSYSYSYGRYVNDILFESDRIYISINPDTLAVTNFTITYSEDAVFPSPEKIIMPDEAVEKYFGEVALNPYYIVTLGKDKDGSLIRARNNITAKEKQLTMVYSYTDYCFIDAFTGDTVNYNGEKYEWKPVKYYRSVIIGDISQSKYKDKINKLADMDVIEADNHFYPARPITQLEYFEMLRYLNSSYYYRYLEYKTIAVGGGERPDDYFSIDFDNIDEKANITRETAVKIIIDAMGYGDAARIEGIYKCPLPDAGKISDGMLGYVSLAYGFGLTAVFGSEFDPQAILTRDEAAALVYEYMMFINRKQNI